MRILPIAIAAALLPLAAACSTTDGYQKAVPPIFNLGPTSTVSGYLTKMDRMALPPDRRHHHPVGYFQAGCEGTQD